MNSNSHVDSAWAYLHACPKSDSGAHAWNPDRTLCSQCGARRLDVGRFASDGMPHSDGQRVKYEDALALATGNASSSANALADIEDAIALLRKTSGFMLSSENAQRIIDHLQRLQAKKPVGYALRFTRTGKITRSFVLPGEEVDAVEEFEWAPLYDLPAVVDPQEAFELGWRTAAEWAKRDDLVSDIGSPAYERDLAQAFERRGKKDA